MKFARRDNPEHYSRSRGVLSAFRGALTATAVAVGCAAVGVGGHVWAFIPAAAAALLASADAILAWKEYRAAESRDVAALLAGGPCRVRDARAREYGIDVEVLPAGEHWMYVRRDFDEQLRGALSAALEGTGPRLVMLCGETKSGKTRSAFQALTDGELADAWLVVPRDGASVEALLRPGGLPPGLAPLVVWLDDIERFATADAAGLHEGALRNLACDRPTVLLATEGGRGACARDGGLLDPVAQLRSLAACIDVPVELTDRELSRAKEVFGGELVAEIGRVGLGRRMVAIAELQDRLIRARDRCREGVAVVRAAVDWRRAGALSPLGAAQLEQLYTVYLPDDLDSDPELFAAGLRWARGPLPDTEISLLRRAGEGYEPYDLAVEVLAREWPEIAPGALDRIAELASPGDCFQMAGAAVEAGDVARARELLARAERSEDRRLAATSAFNTAILLERDGDATAACAAYRRADERGSRRGAFNLGQLLRRDGALAEAEAAFRRADERGSAEGAVNLGVLLEARGQHAGAEAAYRRALERGSRRGGRNLERLRGSAAATVLLLALCGSVLAPWRARAEGLPGEFRAFPVELGASESGLGEIARAADGSIWFVETGATLPGVSSIARLDPSTGVVTAEFVLTGREFGQMAGDAQGNIWLIAYGYSPRLDRISPTGRLTEYPITETEIYEPVAAAGIALGPDGNMWLTEPVAGKIVRLSPDGAVLGEFTTPSKDPTAITAGPKDDMWFIDGEEAIGRITMAGQISELPIPSNKATPVNSIAVPRAIAAATDGSVWFVISHYFERAVQEGDVVGRLAPSGAFSEFSMSTVGYYTTSLVGGLDGNAWFVEPGAKAIDRITPAGEITPFVPPSAEPGFPDQLALDAEGNIWFTGFYGGEAAGGGGETFHLWRFVTPRTPINLAPPTLSGRAAVGQTLVVTEGSWKYKPAGIAYQWQSCAPSAEQCVSLEGESGSSHLVTEDEIGRVLRAVVTVSGPGGSASASATSEVVPAPPVLQPPPPPKEPQARRPTPLPGVTATGRFAHSHSYTIVRYLALGGLPSGGTLQVVCHGRGCAFKRRISAIGPGDCRKSVRGKRRCVLRRSEIMPGDAVISKWFAGRRLAVGTRVSISVTKPGWIGRSFAFTMQPGRDPGVRLGCLVPGSSEQGVLC